ncbi:hypothetical protein AB0J28_04500 [Streptosporangium canum]|uniref:hypothetical protein n=1 Tax=Streptosporangium canum TaxID=324952 RepID=UPI003435727F
MTAKPTPDATATIGLFVDGDLQISAMTGKGKSSAAPLIVAEPTTEKTLRA